MGILGRSRPGGGTGTRHVGTLTNTHWYPGLRGWNEAGDNDRTLVVSHETIRLLIWPQTRFRQPRRGCTAFTREGRKTTRERGSLKLPACTSCMAICPRRTLMRTCASTFPSELSWLPGTPCSRAVAVLDYTSCIGGLSASATRQVKPDTRLAPLGGELLTGADVATHRVAAFLSSSARKAATAHPSSVRDR
jgi:hypothetical protein